MSRALQGTSGHRPAAAAPQPSPMPDLLDLGGGDTPVDESVKAAAVEKGAGGGDDDLLLLGDADFMDAPIKSNVSEVDLSGLNLGGSISAANGNSQELLPGLQGFGDNFLGEQSPSGILPVQQPSSLLPDLTMGSINGTQPSPYHPNSYSLGRSGSGATPGGQQLDDIFTEAAAKAAAQAAGGPPPPMEVSRSNSFQLGYRFSCRHIVAVNSPLDRPLVLLATAVGDKACINMKLLLFLLAKWLIALIHLG